MDSILVFNTGSTSLSFHRYTAESLELIHKGKLAFERPLSSRNEFLRIFRGALREIGNVTDVLGIGHRVVHGGNEFREPLLVDDSSFARLQALSQLAPLHNPWNIAGIEACIDYLSDIPNIAVFDTAFFSNLPPSSRLYAISERERYPRYGFHGISHARVLAKLSSKLRKPPYKLTFISCHLGGGSSIALIEKGMPTETSMGYTALEGLLMMTRAGDIDPGIIFAIAKERIERARTADEARDALNSLEESFYKSAGLFALTGCTSYLDILEKMKAGDERAGEAFTLYCRKIRRYIGAYAALTPKLDAICFTGSIGAGDPLTRITSLKNLSAIKGIPVHVFPPEEELAIAEIVQRNLNLQVSA